MRFLGQVNAYRCSTCGRDTVTVDRDDGVTPFMLGCRASGVAGECSGMAQSVMYSIGYTTGLTPAWEWYRPDGAEIAKLDRDAADHVMRGGLLIRPLSAEGSDD